MSTPRVQYYFRPGRLMKRGRTNPGILIVDRVRAFQCNSISKDMDRFNYCCNERLTVGIKCRAKAVVMKMDVHGKGISPVLVKVDLEHDCPVNVPKAIAEEMKAEMKSLVRSEPQKVLAEAIQTVRRKYSEEFAEDEDVFEQIIAELGPDKPILRQLLRVRLEIVGKTPVNRNKFDPSYFLRKLRGNDHKIVVMDSNELEDGWRNRISITNPESNFSWGNIHVAEAVDEDAEEEYIDENATDDNEAGEMNEDGGYVNEDTDEINLPVYPDVSEKDLPKRVLAYSSEKLLALFGKNLKSSMDGTFKSACTHYKQSFVWMVKFCGHWIPVVHAWLPDKTEESYKVLFLLVKNKLGDLGISMDIKSVISDFELSIIKSVDEMLQVKIEGCFFHFSKALKTKVDKSRFKTRYETDKQFQHFIRSCGALSHLPLSDIEKGLDAVDSAHDFEDEEALSFKAYFLKYLRDFWFNGPFPPSTWNCWGRSEDLTNNHQEGYNARTNRILRQTHPSPGILLCHVYSEIKIAEQTRTQARFGIEKPRAQPKYLRRAKERLRIKKAYLEEKHEGRENITEFLTAMGYNVMASMLVGKSNEVKKTADPRESLIFEQDGRNFDTSTWVPEVEKDISVLEVSSNPYEGRKVGKTKKTQERENILSACSGRKCRSCGKGFNKKSSVAQCHACDAFVHKKAVCTVTNGDTSFCNKCEPNNTTVSDQAQSRKDGNLLQCVFCDYSTKAKFNMKRHVDRKHADRSSADEILETRSAVIPNESAVNLSTILTSAGLEDLTEKFNQEKVDLDMLLELQEDDFDKLMSDFY